MVRIRTQEDFIKKAKEVHDNKYDYSLIEYVKTSVKVKIICPIHGVFEQAPNKHLAGQGCKQCGRERTRMGVDEFIKRAKEVHGDKYDYSKIHEYKSINDKVEIVCPVHGSFWQTPHCHVVLKQNCPKCSNESGGKKRCGDKNVAHRDDVKQKKAETCIQRFGAKTWAESDEGRKKLREIVTSEEVSQKMQDTCMKRYGAEMWSKSDEGREKLHELMSSEEMRKKVADGYQQKYGSHYMQTDEGREKARQYIDDDRRKKMRISMIKHFGVPYALSSSVVQDKIKASFVAKYGVPYVVLSDEERKRSLEKSWMTKRMNGTFSTSKPEDTLYGMLCDVFGKDHVIRQYMDKNRYPFHCDFYIDTIDTFIELNASWVHGLHWFDKNNPKDIEKLQCWRNCAKERGSRYYYSAIHTWTELDLRKKRIAEENNLNYVVFWQNDLSDARVWVYGRTK